MTGSREPNDPEPAGLSLLGFIAATLVSVILLLILMPRLGVALAVTSAMAASFAVLLLDSLSAGRPKS